MRVLFVNPHYTHDPFTLLLHPPLCYGYMAPWLRRAGHEVLHIDLPFEGNSAAALADRLDELAPDIVGVTAVAQSYFHALEVTRTVADWRPEVPVVLGGPHVTFLPEECLKRHPSVDYVLLYDAEHSMVDLVSAVEAGATTNDLAKVPGLAFRDGTGVVVTEPTPPELELDHVGHPDRSLFDMPRYLAYDYETVVMTARGCPSRCTFCSTTLAGRTARWHGAAHVVDEIEQVMGLGFRSIFFGDDTFSGDPERAIEICAEIKRRGIDIPWTSNMRAQDARPQVIDAMLDAGAYRVFMGFESVQQSTLRLVKKGTTPAKLFATARRVMAAGLQLHASFIIGAPGDTNETLQATLNFIRLVNPTVATFNTMEPRPGTDVARNPERYGITIADPYWYESDDWLDLPVCWTDHLSQVEIRDWVYRCYDEFCSSDFRCQEVLDGLDDVRRAWEEASTRPRLNIPVSLS